jgi:predicted ATP-grasp superfamily ATP-dependent carboligase
MTAAGAQLVIAPSDAVEWATNKAATQQSALAAGARIPRTVVVAPDTFDPVGVIRSLRAPLVIKATQSEHLRADGRLQSTGAPQYARTHEEAARVLTARVAAGMTVQVQEFVEGGGAGWFAFMEHGRLVAEFAHRRLRDVRPTGSGSALRESVAVDPRLRDIGLAMLQEKRWHGVAMVEFRMDDEGEPVFLEVNGRFWNSLALAIHAGVDFPRLCADAVLGQLPASVPAFKAGVRCRWFLGDARHLVAVMRGAPAGFPGRFPGRLSTLASMLVPHPGTFHDNFQLDDPLPELGDWADLAVHRIPGLLSR